MAAGRAVGLALALCLAAGAAGAEPAAARPDTIGVASDKLRVDRGVLIYDTIEVPEAAQDILWDDVAAFRAMLAAHPDLTMVQLNSYGGDLTAARDMAGMVAQRGLATRIDGTCDSACVLIYLAGDDRSLAAGSTIGFHRFTWDPVSVRAFFDGNSGDYGWSDPFDMAAWLYEDTQAEIYDHLVYLLARGVDPAFAIQTLRQSSDGMWYPPRPVLIAAGVVTTADAARPDLPPTRSAD